MSSSSRSTEHAKKPSAGSPSGSRAAPRPAAASRGAAFRQGVRAHPVAVSLDEDDGTGGGHLTSEEVAPPQVN